MLIRKSKLKNVSMGTIDEISKKSTKDSTLTNDVIFGKGT